MQELEIYFNGQLRTDLLGGATIVSHGKAQGKWYVLCRNAPLVASATKEQYTEYQTDENDIFQVVKRYSGSAPTVARRLREHLTFLNLRDDRAE